MQTSTARRLRRIAAALAVGLALGAGSLWYRMLSPWGYTPPPDLPQIEAGVAQRVFAYGTLRNALVRRIVVGRHVRTGQAELPGYRKQGLDLRAQAEASVEGEVFMVEADELRRLDRYERVGVRYERFEGVLGDGSRAWVYRRIERR